MQVVKEILSPCQVSLQITVEPDKVAQAVDKVYREFSKFIAVPGFRKGHAPLAFVKPRVPEDQLRERTTELLVEPAYKEAIEQEQVSPFASPNLELVSLEVQPPDQKFEFKALVPLAPKVELGEYRAIAVDRERYEVTDDAVDKRLEQMQQRAAEYPLVKDRPAQIGDVLLTDLTTTPDGASEPGVPQQTVINLGDQENVPGLDEQLVGMSVAEEKSFRLKYPDNFSNEELAGKEAGFFVKVVDIHEKNVPVLDDEFAKKFGNAETLDEMKATIRGDIERQIANFADSVVETRLIDQIVAVSSINYPDVLVETEVEASVRDLLQELEHRHVELADYLERLGTTEEGYLADLREKAIKRIQRGLALAEIASKEDIKLEEGDVDVEIADRAAKNRTTPEAVRAYIDANNQLGTVSREALTKKIIGFLKASAIITEKLVDPNADLEGAADDAPQDSGAAETVATPDKPKRTRKKKAE